MQFKTWQSKISDFRISKYLHGFHNEFHRRHIRFQGHWQHLGRNFGGQAF